MSYRHIKGWRWIGVKVRASGPWRMSGAAQVITPVLKKYPGNADLHRLIEQFAEAECDFLVRRDILNECNTALVKSAIRNFRPYVSNVRKPSGFSSAGRLVDKESIDLGAKSEALISLYLDGLYIIKDRMIAATKALNAASLNKVWPCITKKRPSSKGKRHVTWQNLLDDFRNVGEDERIAGDNFEYACSKLRGTRTHALHYQVHLEHDPADAEPTVHYATEAVYVSPSPQISFSDRARGDYSKGMMEMVGWWQAQTSAML